MKPIDIPLPEKGLLRIGWSEAKRTFFAHVFGKHSMDRCRESTCWRQNQHHRVDCDQTQPEVWLGCRDDELPTFDSLRAALHPLGLDPLLTDERRARFQIQEKGKDLTEQIEQVEQRILRLEKEGDLSALVDEVRGRSLFPMSDALRAEVAGIRGARTNRLVQAGHVSWRIVRGGKVDGTGGSRSCEDVLSAVVQQLELTAVHTVMADIERRAGASAAEMADWISIFQGLVRARLDERHFAPVPEVHDVMALRGRLAHLLYELGNTTPRCWTAVEAIFGGRLELTHGSYELWLEWK